ncbi:MAG: glutamate--cysteine ligase [Gammaproteobacteria bacterium]|nr:glutamate--cysteine ligase [Gammaproteobacteria bacterium]
MGISIDREEFSENDYLAFSGRLYDSLDVLKGYMQRPSFGKAPKLVGAELENYIVDSAGKVLPINQKIIKAADDARYTVELNRFNLEVNFDPFPLSGNVFSELQQNIDDHLSRLQTTANEFDAEIVPIGILPTLQYSDLGKHSMTDLARYRSLSKQLFKMRGEHFQVDISGEEQLQVNSNHVALEGANTSFQFHLMINHENFANAFNAVQLTTPLVLALAANSPIFLGKSLWDETRIALFKQSIDSRRRGEVEWRQPSRVSFGHGWVRKDAHEIFAEAVALYPPMFPILSDISIDSSADNDNLSPLDELCLHMGTIWPWNRPVYCPKDGGHVRIEMRALPAGPSSADMCASAAFAAGLAFGLNDHIEDLLAVTPFRFAEYNFYRAAQKGLDASIVWTQPSKHKPQEQAITTVIESMLPIAEKGLVDIGLNQHEIDRHLGNIRDRLSKKQTGAIWQRKMLSKLNEKHDKQTALFQMFQHYRQWQKTKAPITEWSFERLK